MSLNTESTIDASKTRNAERTGKTTTGVLSDMIKERIRTNLEPLNAQISTLIQLLHQLIRENSVKITPRLGTRTHGPQTQILLSRETRTSRTLPGKPLVVRTLSRHIQIF